MRRERKEREGTGMGPLGAKTLQQINDKNQRPKETENTESKDKEPIYIISIYESRVFNKMSIVIVE